MDLRNGSYRQASSAIAASRKRKLRVLYALTATEAALPRLPSRQTNDPPITPDEAVFLAKNERILDESTIPTRRLRSSTIALKSSTSQPRTSSYNKVNGTSDTPPSKRFKSPRSSTTQRVKSHEPPNDTPTLVIPNDHNLDQVPQHVDPGSNGAIHIIEPTTSQSDAHDVELIRSLNGDSAGAVLETERIQRIVESRPSSPGVELQEVVPALSGNEDAVSSASLVTPTVDEHKAATIHLPPKQVQEDRLRHEKTEHAVREQQEKDARRLSVKVLSDSASSPGSTEDAQSATTPRAQPISTDTSPEANDNDNLPSKKTDESPATPPELQPTEAEAAEKEMHDHLLKAQIDLARTVILESDPPTAEAQLRQESLQAAVMRKVTSMPDMEVDDEVVGVQIPSAAAPRDQQADAMDVDTESAAQSLDEVQTVSSVLESGLAANPVAASDIDPPAATTSSAPEDIPPPPRMTTRVSSGAMRQKSVAEILGARQPLTTTPATQPEPLRSPTVRPQSLVSKAKDSRNKISSIVFARQVPKKNTRLVSVMPHGSEKPQLQDDYLLPLIQGQSYHDVSEHPTFPFPKMDNLLGKAAKTMTTADTWLPFHDHQAQKIILRILSLQQAQKWSFRQMKRAPEPNRPLSHRDELLKEMRWMRTDFRQERKWKIAAARDLANACAEWAQSNAANRLLLQVKARAPLSRQVDAIPASQIERETSDTPELEASADSDAPTDDYEEEINLSMIDTVAPSAIFCTDYDSVVYGLKKSAATDRLFDELPWYKLPFNEPDSDVQDVDMDPDAAWRRPAVPLSKYMEAKVILPPAGAPRRKGRWQVEEESEDEDGLEQPLPPELDTVALFNPQNKSTRDRLYAGHHFRPPSDHPMPQQSFYESRSSSHWLWEEDNELKTMVREYCYNWPFISSMFTTRSLFQAGSERRTSWECFERWISLEGLPNDMSRSQYFRQYNNRLEAANRALVARVNQETQAAGTAGAAGAAGTPSVALRRRTNTSSIRVERKRAQKHLTLTDAMRKLAKKRETAASKQAHAQNLASIRKESAQPANLGVQVKHTPQDFSRLKADREEKLKAHVLQLQQQQQAQQRAMLQARNAAAQQNAHQQYGMQNPAALQQARMNPNGMPSAQMQNRGNQLAVPGQNAPHAPMQGIPNGNQPNGITSAPQMPMKPMPQAQMHGVHNLAQIQSMQRANGLPVTATIPADIRLMAQARQLQEQQRQTVMQQQNQQHAQNRSPQMHGSPGMRPPNINGSQQKSYMQNNQAMMANWTANAQAQNGTATPPTNGYSVPHNGQATANSPRVPHQAQPKGYPGNSIPINKIEQAFRTQNPTATAEQVQKHVRDIISNTTQQMSQQSQVAMLAAAGGLPLGAMNSVGGAMNTNGNNIAAGSANMQTMNGTNGGGGMGSTGLNTGGMQAGIQTDPRQYAQMLRAQQEIQSKNVQQSGVAMSTSQGQQNHGHGPGQGMGPGAQAQIHMAAQGQAHGQGQSQNQGHGQGVSGQTHAQGHGPAQGMPQNHTQAVQPQNNRAGSAGKAAPG